MSPRFSLSADDVKKTLRGLALTVGGAALTAAAQWLSSTDFGAYGPLIVVPVLGGVLELGRRWIADQSK